MCAGTHPFAAWNHQKVTDKERYATLIDRTQWWGRQMLIYGVHVHVGIEDRDKVLPISRAMLTVYGHLQALSASSPFWGGNETGYASNRALMFQQLPTAGLPFQFEEWSQLEHYVDDMLHTGVIDSFDEIRWDLRPSPKFGTLEVRVCDGIPSMSESAQHLGADPLPRRVLLDRARRGPRACRRSRRGSRRRTSGARPGTAWTRS
ncbi:YbdK family carboxylate-amine ligase [Aeromicrobium sp. UC242_57]|uniref:YbdK family carboxylate-amine ligase n=1 Tax=Aeromicrobium sp. UC242_57 TaxID=3374624 RepID=UPI0037932243